MSSKGMHSTQTTINSGSDSNIAFSTVWEDPAIETFLIDKYMLNKPQDYDYNYLNIASGGCTIFTLMRKNVSIDAIDSNIEQLHLCEFKLCCMVYFNCSDKVFDFLEGNMFETQYNTHFTDILQFLTKDCRLYWQNTNINKLYHGLNKIGKYERLFKDLKKSNYDFESVFNRQNLIDNFGEKAVCYSSKSFSEHFEKVLQIYTQKYTTKNNYFYSRMTSGTISKLCKPVFYNNLNNICNYKSNINLIHSNALQHLCNTCKKYDFINLSNITDWHDEDEINKILQLSYDRLKDQGILCIRQLISDVNMNLLIKKYFVVCEEMMQHQDHSHFYTHIFVARKTTKT